ncbi:response regulator [Hahella sp. HN01]|uniref:response regulator n=1 Tax=Hahella sp. HN01 TaxID=2847262 RepID=UPI001C1E9A96|nr:response regulator [Hahella sp. HN01]MBU6954104.1 response regulator [Hahella sp. HN01]
MFNREYRNARFLIVDGNTQLRLALEKMLKSFGAWYIDMAADGDEAINKCEHGLFDVVICDYQLSGRNGQHVLEELRERKILRYTSLFVMMSAETTREMVLAAIDHQPDAYINKPITSDVLKQRLDNLLVDNEVLYELKHAIDMERWSEAISRCEEKIARGSKYLRWCEKTVAELYFQTGVLNEALRVYQQVLSERTLIWAQVGVARVYIAQADYDLAEELLRKVVEAAPNCLVAYDLLARVLVDTHRGKEAQEWLVDAVGLSPTAILRHARLGDIAWENQDVDCAVEAFRNAVELGRKSIFDRLDNHLGFSRSLCERAGAQPKVMREAALQETFEVLRNMDERFVMNDTARFQYEVVAAKACCMLKHEEERDERLALAETLYQSVGFNLPSSRVMEYAQVLLASGKDLEAEFILSQLSLMHGDEPELQKRIEEMRDEPVSPAARQKAAELNKQGIKLAEQEDFKGAVAAFNEALEYSARHPALNLNLAQVLLKQLSSSPGDGAARRACAACFDRIVHIKPTHKQYPRFQHLRTKFEGTHGGGVQAQSAG